MGAKTQRRKASRVTKLKFFAFAIRKEDALVLPAVSA
jgi:hypothetical protein